MASKETGIEINADKSMCMVMSPDQNARRSHSVKTAVCFFESVDSSSNWEEP